jgi:hypothetical protein
MRQHVFTAKINEQNLCIFDFIKETGFDLMDDNFRSNDVDFAKVMKKNIRQKN